MLQDEESDDISDKTMEKMTAIIGQENQQFTMPLLHLVIADSAYCDANKDQQSLGNSVCSIRVFCVAKVLVFELRFECACDHVVCIQLATHSVCLY